MSEPEDRREVYREELLEAHRQMAARDRLFRESQERLAWQEQHIASLEQRLRDETDALRQEIVHLKGVVSAMRATGVWRAAERWWALRRRAAALLGVRRGAGGR